MTNNNISKRLRAFIYKTFPGAKISNLGDGESLLTSGVVDSQGILEILNFIEEEFKINVENEELIPDNFETIINLTKFIQDKQ